MGSDQAQGQLELELGFQVEVTERIMIRFGHEEISNSCTLSLAYFFNLIRLFSKLQGNICKGTGRFHHIKQIGEQHMTNFGWKGSNPAGVNFFLMVATSFSHSFLCAEGVKCNLLQFIRRNQYKTIKSIKAIKKALFLPLFQHIGVNSIMFIPQCSKIYFHYASGPKVHNA